MRNKKGFIIIIAMVVATALSVMAGAFSLGIFYRNQIIMDHIASIKSYYISWSAINYESANFHFPHPSAMSTISEVVRLADSSGTIYPCTVNITPSEDSFNISCSVTIKNKTRTLYCQLEAEGTPLMNDCMYTDGSPSRWDVDNSGLIKWR